MEFPVIVEPLGPASYRATAGDPFGLQAEGATSEEAISNLRASMNRKLHGKTVVGVNVGDNPWLALAGSIDPSDPLTAEWEAEMASYRAEFENDPTRP